MQRERQKILGLIDDFDRRKAELFSGVMDDGDLFAGSLAADDIRGLLDEPAGEQLGQAGGALAEAA